jgi:adenylate cyclase
MHERDIEQIATWITERALAGASETELLHGLCERANAAGLPVSSAIAIIDTLHPIWGAASSLAE